MKRIYYTTGRRLDYRDFSRVEGPDVVSWKRMLHATATGVAARAFRIAGVDPTPKMQDLRKRDPASYDKIAAESRKANADYTREFSLFDDEAIAAVDKFRADHNLNYQGNAPGLVDARLIDSLRGAYYEKKKAAAKR